MTIEELYQQILSGFYALEGAKELLDETVSVTGAKEPEKTLRPENDPPSTVARPEYCVTATLRGVRGTLEEALHIPPSEKGISAVTIAALNAAMSCLGLAPGVFPEEEEAHFRYAEKLYRYVIENHGPDNIVLVGYDGYLVKRFVDEGLIIWIMDRDPDHIAQDRFHHVVVNNAKRNRESSFVWGKYFIVTGSTLCNGTILHYLNSGKELLYYGITCAGAAKLLKLPWFSPENM